MKVDISYLSADDSKSSLVVKDGKSYLSADDRKSLLAVKDGKS